MRTWAAVFATIALVSSLVPTEALAAFGFLYDGTTLTLTQSVDDGDIIIDDNGAGSAFRATDGSGTTLFFAATHLIVNLLANTANQLDLDLDNAHAGDVILNLGDGARDVNLTGTSNSTGGDLIINAGAGGQVIEIGVNNTLTVGGSLSFDLGMGPDVVDEDNSDIAITGDLNFTGVNFFENGGTMMVGGNANVDVSFETEDTLFDDDATMTINGNLTYTGGDGRDEVTMNGVAGGFSVLGNAIVNVGDNTVGGVQFIFFNLPNASVGGDLTATSTASTNTDSFALHPSGSVGGNISVDLGDGPNDAVFAGPSGGTTGSYVGGSGIDNVTVGSIAPGMDFVASLGEGIDNFVLNPGVQLSSLNVDFGCPDDDVFVDALGGVYPFPATFINQLGPCPGPRQGCGPTSP